MNKKLIISSLVIIIIIAAAAVVGYPYLKKQGKIGHYTEQYNVNSLDLGKIPNTNPEIAKRYKDKFIEYQDKLEAAVREYEAGGKQELMKPNPDFFVEKARYADYLGKSDWAIGILNETFIYYDNSSVAWNNLAKIYEERKDYAKANEYYQKIIDTFGEGQMWGQYYYMIKNYMLAGDKEKAREYYQKYRRLGGAEDGEVNEFLK